MVRRHPDTVKTPGSIPGGPTMFSLYVTFPDEKSARKIAKELVTERLIACASLFPIASFYMWKGKRVEEKEWAMIAKCSKSNARKAEVRILALHPYGVPAILWHGETATAKYAKWAEKQSK
jgi:periplasmic divalent cation tolerance protein